MIKKSILISIGTVLFLAVISTSVIAYFDYCSVSAKNTNYEWITRVSLNGNEKASNNSTYSDFTDTLLTTLNIGETYIIYVDVKTTWNYNEFVKAWIDFNNDGNFSNDEEINLGNATFSGNHTFNKIFTVPSNSTPSETRMRIYLKYAFSPSACKNTTSGEIEDYKIKLIFPTQACTDGLSKSCGSGNCLGTQICLSGVWGSCTAECSGLGTDCQDKCVGNVWYHAGLCNLNSCSCDYTTENCDSQNGCYVYESGCEDRFYFCQASGCNYTFSNRNTDKYDNFINYCSADTIRTHRTFNDFSCDGTCKDYTSWTDDSEINNCNGLDNWYNTTSTQWLNISQYIEKEQIKQEYRDYTCSPLPIVSCNYIVNNTLWIDTGRTRAKASVKYCPVSIKNTCSFYEWITRVSLNGNEKISNNSTYSNFTNTLLTTLNAGMPYTLYADVKTIGNYNEFVKAWIDFNNDGNFSNDEEINLGSLRFFGNHTFNNTFIVPSNSVLSETRMRVYLKWAATPSACENASFGEIEDYKIKII